MAANLIILTAEEYQREYQSIRLQTRPNSTPLSAAMVKTLAQPDACPTCGFPPGSPGFLRSEFPVGHPRFGALIPCPDCHDGNLAVRLTGASQLKGWLRDATLNTYRTNRHNRAAFDATKAFVERRAGWLTLWGGYGTGKTHLLAAAVNLSTNNRVAAVYYTLPDLLDAMRAAYQDDSFDNLFSRLVRLPILALDELDKVRLTDWAREKLYQLFDARYRDLERLGTICATNTKPDPADTDMGYLYSRMTDRRSTIVEIGGGDVRPVEV